MRSWSLTAVALSCLGLLGCPSTNNGTDAGVDSGSRTDAGGVITVTISPTTATVAPGATRGFTATVTGTSNTAVTWAVQEGSSGGSINTNGVYTAPGSAGTFHVVATSAADTTKTA